MTSFPVDLRAPRRHGWAGKDFIDSQSKRALVTALFFALAVSMLFPLFMVIVASFKTLDEYQRSSIGVPQHWTFENYREAWAVGHLGPYALHSALVTAITIVLLVGLATPAGYAFAHMSFPFRRSLLVFTISLVIVSQNQLVVPIFRTAQQLGLLNQYFGLAVVFTGLHLPFGIYLMSSYFEGVPRSLFQAAAIDGAGAFRTFFGIALPIARPGVLTLVTFTFLGIWNEYLYSLLILQDPTKRTLMVGIQLLQSSWYVSQPMVSAGLIVAIIPCLIMFVLLQRNLNEGLTAGAVKE